MPKLEEIHDSVRDHFCLPEKNGSIEGLIFKSNELKAQIPGLLNSFTIGSKCCISLYYDPDFEYAIICTSEDFPR